MQVKHVAGESLSPRKFSTEHFHIQARDSSA
jgi:hypothetical protein